VSDSVPKVVVFDLGKVLLDFDYGIVAPKIAKFGAVSAAEVKKMLNQSALLHRFEMGLMTTKQFFDQVAFSSRFTGTIEQFSALFGDIFTPIPAMIELHARLRKAGVSTWIFSNTNELAIGHIRRSYPFFADFDGHIFSYEHGAMKPDAKLYEVVEQMTARRGGDILYLDDRIENVKAGEQRDWRVILHETTERTMSAFREVGLPV